MRFIPIALVLAATASTAWADRPGEDHPLLPRYAGAAIKNYRPPAEDQVVLPIARIDDATTHLNGLQAKQRMLKEEVDAEDIGLTMQAKLLRVLQEHEIKRVGGTETIKIDVRIIAATNQSLSGLVARKLFRPDLYYRLCGVDVQVPPLRERRDDIAPLARDTQIDPRFRMARRASDAFLKPLCCRNYMI